MFPKGKNQKYLMKNNNGFHNLGEYIENIINVGRDFLSMKVLVDLSI